MDKLGATIPLSTAANILATSRATSVAEKSDKVTVKTLDDGSRALAEAQIRIVDASRSLREAEKELTERAKSSLGRVKDMTNQVAEQVARVNKLLGADVEPKIAQLERVVSALERLNELKVTGALPSLMSALEKMGEKT
jgi:polyhydroxyalkanoate synthesis regulator phasin